jgi:hypothetical protein
VRKDRLDDGPRKANFVQSIWGCRSRTATMAWMRSSGVGLVTRCTSRTCVMYSAMSARISEPDGFLYEEDG